MIGRQNPTQALVAKIERRDVLTADERQALTELMEPGQRHGAGAILISPGDRPASSTLLISGFCARFSLLSDGSRSLTQLSVPGDFLDLHSLLMRQMDHGIVALSECLVSRAPHEKIVHVAARHPHLGRLLWLDTVIDGAIHREWLHRMGAQNALGRMAHLICEMETRLSIVGLVDQERGFELPLTQADLADCLGLSAVHVNRTLMELRRLGLVEWRAGRVRLLNRDRLFALAEFDPRYLRLVREPV